jgi:hypothetical protein
VIFFCDNDFFCQHLLMKPFSFFARTLLFAAWRSEGGVRRRTHSFRWPSAGPLGFWHKSNARGAPSRS